MGLSNYGGQTYLRPSVSMFLCVLVLRMQKKKSIICDRFSSLITCVCVCVCVYVCACACMCVWLCVYTHTRSCMYVCASVLCTTINRGVGLFQVLEACEEMEGGLLISAVHQKE